MSQEKKFVVLVLEATLSNNSATVPHYSKPEYNALLGSAGYLVLQICLDAVTQATTTVTVTYQTSNTGEEQDWKDSTFSKTLVAVNTSDTPKSSFETISSLVDLGAFGRFKVVSDKAIATVRLVVCGRG